MSIHLRKTPVLETDALILRPFQLKDTSALFVYASDPRVSYLTQWQPHATTHQTKQFIQSVVHAPFWAIIDKNSQQLIGECGVKNIHEHSGELYCALAPSWWGKGLATQATRAVLDIAFNHYQLTSMHGWILAANSRSQALAHKLGMQHEATIHNGWYTPQQLHDIHVYVVNR